jgi:geranylgeranyl diphosphate synthase type II|tara:strand:- start:17059 stop:18021 length:963 start_codon:yes stop_codon:yes gene_type:complete
MQKLKEIIAVFEANLPSITEQPGEPREVYEPISYILNIGGKRIRPAMTIAAYKLYQEKISDDVIKLAQAIEMFHNFTLMHDDIMDNSLLRRGHQTVHLKWDNATAILCGDLLQIEVYEKLTEIGSIEILNLFNKMARELCEGQMNDMMFETREIVSNEDYLHMIKQKTAVLIGFSLQAGALLGGANESESNALYDLGISMGLSFQLMDDYLDSFGEKAKVGKKIGGDILNKKKTFLWNEMWANLNSQEKKSLNTIFESGTDSEIIDYVKDKMKSTGADKKTLQLAQNHAARNGHILSQMSSEGNKDYLNEIMTLLSKREN